MNQMKNFLKLNRVIVNMSHIVRIDIYPTKYTMIIGNHHLHGGFIAGSGTIDTYVNKLEICQTINPSDYQIVKEWVEKIN